MRIKEDEGVVIRKMADCREGVNMSAGMEVVSKGLILAVKTDTTTKHPIKQRHVTLLVHF